MKIAKLRKEIELSKARSAWSKGVKLYALELLDNLTETEFYNSPADRKTLLYGADSWEQYSEGGCSLIFNADICERLCTPSEIKKTKNGTRNPSSRENWVDCQTRALTQAERLIIKTWRLFNND